MSEKIEATSAYQAAYIFNGIVKASIIPYEFKNAYVKEFGDKIPSDVEFVEWQIKNGIDSIPVNGDGDENMTGYIIIPEILQQIYDFMAHEPYYMVKPLMESLFEIKNGSYYTKEGIEILSAYINEFCPTEVKEHFLLSLANGGLEKYHLKSVKKEEIVEKSGMKILKNILGSFKSKK
jgi:hypothetical protein